jgi:hypothetical protein
MPRKGAQSRIITLPAVRRQRDMGQIGEGRAAILNAISAGRDRK